MSRSPDTKKKAAQRQERYRQRKREKYLHGLRTIVYHWRYRAAIRETLAHLRKNIVWLSQQSGIEPLVIEVGRDDDYGLFRPEEIKAIQRWLPQVPAPRI